MIYLNSVSLIFYHNDVINVSPHQDMLTSDMSFPGMFPRSDGCVGKKENDLETMRRLNAYFGEFGP